MPGDPVGIEVDAEALVEEFEGKVGVVSVEEEVVLVAADGEPGAAADEVGAAHERPVVGGRS